MEKLVLPAETNSLPDPAVRSKELLALHRLLDASPDVICSIDAEGRFIYISAAAKQLWGFEPGELLGRKCIDLIVPEDQQRTLLVAQAIMAGVEFTSFENRYRRKNGSVIPIVWSATWSEEEQTMYCVAKDGTQLKETRRQNELQERRLERAYKLAGLAWWEYDMATQTYTSSDEIFEMYGVPIPRHNQSSLEEFLSLVHPDDRARLAQDLTTLSQETYINYEHRIVKPSGDVIHVLHYSEIVRDENGHAIALHGTAKDITEIKKTQLQLGKSEKKLVTILESIQECFFSIDHHWTVTYLNKKAEEVLHINREDILGKNIWEMFPEARQRKFYPKAVQALDEKAAVQFEEYFPPLALWVEVSLYPSEDGLSVFFKNINDRKQKEILRIRQEEEMRKLSLIAKETQSAVVITTPDRRVTWVNPAFTRMTGYSFEEIAGKRQASLLEGPQTDPDTVRYVLDEYRKQRPFSVEILNYKKNGEPFWSELHIQPLFDAEGNIEQFFSIRNDITERKRLEKELEQARLRTTAAVIEAQEKERTVVSQELHDNVNQVLTTVKLYTEMCRDGVGNCEAILNKSIQLLQASINEIRSLSKRLSAPSLGKIKLSESVKELVDAVSATGKLTIHLNTEGIDLLEVGQDIHLAVYRILQEQLTNILKHAAATHVEVVLDFEEDHLSVWVKDNGKGFDLKKKAAGIGITNMITRAESIKGKISINSSPGKGCHLSLTIPL